MLGRFRKLGRVNQGIIIGCMTVIVLTCALLTWSIYSLHHISQTSIKQPLVKPYSAPKDSISGKPISLKIPSLQINLPVINGQYNPKTHGWTLTDNNVQYLVDSAQPNNIGGKTFIYGHAVRNIFGKLYNIQPGAGLSLTTNNGYKFNYRFGSSFTTSPSDLSVLSNTKKPLLYLQTCSGFFSQNRQIFIFKYVSYKKIKV